MIKLIIETDGDKCRYMNLFGEYFYALTDVSVGLARDAGIKVGEFHSVETCIEGEPVVQTESWIVEEIRELMSPTVKDKNGLKVKAGDHVKHLNEYLVVKSITGHIRFSDNSEMTPGFFSAYCTKAKQSKDLAVGTIFRYNGSDWLRKEDEGCRGIMDKHGKFLDYHHDGSGPLIDYEELSL